MDVLRRRFAVAILSVLVGPVAVPGPVRATEEPAVTTTTLPACRGLRAECRCADDVGCTAIFECAAPTVSCEEVRAICVSHCAEHGGPGDCEHLTCVDSCTDRRCE